VKRPAASVGAAFLAGAAVAAFVGSYWWNSRSEDPEHIRRALLKNPQIIADSPDVLAAARTVLRARRLNSEGEARARLLSGRWAPLTHPAFSPTLGNPAAPSLLIEFTDYACGPCKASAPPVAEALRSDPDLRVALMLLPIEGPIAEFAARVAYACYQQNPVKFARFHQLLMSEQRPLSETVVLDRAADAGLDLEQIRQDIDANRARDYLAQVRSFAEELNVVGVPTFAMGTRLISGGASNSQIAALVRMKPPAPPVAR
jgi:protein-disulfide isomerase